MPDSANPAQPRRRRWSVNAALDNVFFIVAGAASVWLAYLVLTSGFSTGWAQIWFYLLFWVIVAYIALPRLHRILTDIYVPNYFIGRTRTSDGLLGDPVNLALLGDEAQLHSAMIRAGWTRADDLSLRSAGRIVASTLLRRSYDEAPVSPLMLFGRNQDFAYQQEVAGNPAKRHHVRFWRCPDGWLLPGGHRVEWLAAGTYDRAVGFSLFTLQITHKIEENTDIERDHIVATLIEADPAVAVRLLKDFATGYHSRNGGGDQIVTDGDLPVIDLSAVDTSPEGVAQATLPVPTPGTDATAGTPDKRVRRPAPTTFGGVVVILEAFTPLVTLIGAWLNWFGFRDALVVDIQEDADPQTVQTVLWILLALFAVFFVVELALGILVLAGSNIARIAVMTLSVLTIVQAAVAAIMTGAVIDLATNLVSLSLSILILVALSSQRSRDYARRPRERKASRIAVAA
ncbi:LssY C-terminal domain-containing protein [Cnuibacter sp. UC19_7]|uniref:LssY C-terminal domain-containing protein n=1 Tax=Cnuibacter sp. UC19_7 TaxID=3350166 RepID=UPI00366D5050